MLPSGKEKHQQSKVSNCLEHTTPLSPNWQMVYITTAPSFHNLSCAGLSAKAAPAPAADHVSQQGIAWFVQVSDLHINKLTHPEIVADLLAFGDQVLSGVQPRALLLTGDLVDAKTKAEGSQQHPEEWQVGGLAGCSVRVTWARGGRGEA